MHYKPEIVSAYFVECGLPKPEFEFRFLTERRFRFDIAWPQNKIYVEVCGGLWIPISGHKSGVSIKRDYEKANLAAINGWIGLHVEPKQVCMMETVENIKQLFSVRLCLP
jgi:hypothetical protein